MFPWGKFPFNEETNKMSNQMNPAEIQSYVNDMIKKFTPSHWENPTDPKGQNHEEKKSVDAAVFETFDHVFIRITLINNEQPKQVKFFHTSNLAIIENFFELGDRHTIPLPCLVKRKGATAVVRDLILEVKIPKNVDMQFTEVDISEKL